MTKPPIFDSGEPAPTPQSDNEQKVYTALLEALGVVTETFSASDDERQIIMHSVFGSPQNYHDAIRAAVEIKSSARGHIEVDATSFDSAPVVRLLAMGYLAARIHYGSGGEDDQPYLPKT